MKQRSKQRPDGQDPAAERERESLHREAQADQSGRIRHYLDLAETLLEDEFSDGELSN